MKPGDKVICINDKNWYDIPVRCICEGLVYKLTEVFTCKCGNIYVRLAEVDKYMDMWCPKCNITEFTRMYFHIERFRKIDHSENSEKETDSEVFKEKVISFLIHPN